MNASKIIIKSRNVTERQIRAAKDGRLIDFREQRAALDNGGDFPEPFNINLDKDQPPYPEGEYTLDPACLIVGEFNKLAIGRLKLLPLRAASAPRAAAG